MGTWQGIGAGPGSGDTDFITVGGSLFGYAASAEAAVRNFESTGNADSIIDRAGNGYPLLAGAGGHLTLGHPTGKADIDRLRAAWEAAQQENPRRYPLERLTPDSEAGFLASLFEVLEETAAGTEEGRAWIVRQPGRTHHLGSLEDVNALLLTAKDLQETILQDPYGHLYRPHRMVRGTLALTDRHYLVYREEFPGDVPGT